jgi:pimeloyl-ACP methyl ester carboxylesterase
MEPQVQYLTTDDGVNIAYASVGEGSPILSISTPNGSHVERSWALLPYFYNPLAEAFRVIRFDHRGTSLSDRDAIDFSMETMIRDIEAVVDRTKPGVFSVVAFLDAVPIAVTYAAAHPDQVTHLVLIDGWAGGDDIADMPGRKAIDALMDQDFTLITETMVKVLWGFDDPRLMETGGEYIRACIEPEAFRAFMAEARNYDVTALLANVRAKTLVLHNERNNIAPIRAG